MNDDDKVIVMCALYDGQDTNWVPNTSTDHVCAKCGKNVLLAQSSINSLQADGLKLGDAEIQCILCVLEHQKPEDLELMAPTSEQKKEFADALRKMKEKQE